MEKELAAAEAAISSFQKTLDDAEKVIRPLLKYIEASKEGEEPAEIPPITRARLHATLAYTVNSLYYMYLRANAMESDGHPVVDDTVRIQNTFSRLRAVEKAYSKGNADVSTRTNKMRKALEKVDEFLTLEERQLNHALEGNTTKYSPSAKKGYKRFANEGSSEADIEESIVCSEPEKKKKKKKKKKLSTEETVVVGEPGNLAEAGSSVSHDKMDEEDKKKKKKNKHTKRNKKSGAGGVDVDEFKQCAPEPMVADGNPTGDSLKTPISEKKEKKTKPSSSKKKKSKKSKE